jgi:hypothetical protein
MRISACAIAPVAPLSVDLTFAAKNLAAIQSEG